ncbi:glycosyltransferase [Paraclostridium sordellii]|uniref:glycosyltransferase n=1 Tax=Paraclostridium sordellii TaxID=1505 RepID=UPI000E50EA3A|nr:glycosyltransferase [Paeniclostridium sordellii]RGX08019.1 glycosyltransferase [Paeniclostridium sordellii]
MKKKVGLIIPSMKNGGAERVLSTMSLNFDKDIEQYIYVWDGEKADYEYKGNLIDLGIENKTNLFANVVVLIKRVLKIRKYKKEHKIETSISFLEGPNIVNILSRYKEKVIITVHNFQSKERKGLYGKIFKFLIKRYYNNADLIVAVSKLIKEDLIKNFNIDESKIEVIYNPYDIELIRSKMCEELEDEHKEIFNKPVIINIGRLTHQKGQWKLIKSFKEIKKQIPDVKLVIMGKGELEEDLKNLTKKLGINSDVHFLGFQKNPFKFIHKSKVFALSSFYEGFPMCLAESLACETSIVSTDCNSGPNEILNIEDNIYEKIDSIKYGDFGILVPNFKDESIKINNLLDEDELNMASAIIMMLNDAELRKKYESIGKKRVEDFSVKKIMKQWQKNI